MTEFRDKYYAEKDIQYILYGHTHEARHDYFFGDKNGKVKMYINTGTFLPYIQKTKDKKSFASAYQMTINEQKRKTKMPTLRKIKRGVLPTHLPTQKHHI